MHADLGFLSPAGAGNQTNNLLIIGRLRSLLSQFIGPGTECTVKKFVSILKKILPGLIGRVLFLHHS